MIPQMKEIEIAEKNLFRVGWEFLLEVIKDDVPRVWSKKASQGGILEIAFVIAFLIAGPLMFPVAALLIRNEARERIASRSCRYRRTWYGVWIRTRGWGPTCG